MKEIKILGVVFALPPLKGPAYLLRWFLEWKKAQILTPAFRRLGEAARSAAHAARGLAKAMKDAGMEEE